MLGSVPAGQVSVYETGDVATAHFGELSVTALSAPGGRLSKFLGPE